MKPLEDSLRKHAVYSVETARVSPIKKILSEYTLEPLSMGMQTRVYRVKGEKWVVKEGRWDMEFQLSKDVKIPVPVKITQDILGLFDLSFLPTEKEMIELYRDYLTFSFYFGNFHPDVDSANDPYFHPKVDEIIGKQMEIRENIPEFIKRIEERHDLEIPERTKQILNSDVRYHNFLPKEYLLIGKSLQKKHTEKLTYFIFQPFISGATLHDTDIDTLSIDEQHQLTLLAFLILLMHDDLDVIPDTRPRYPVIQAGDWLTKTDNVIVSKHGLKFVDTRWLWKTKSNFIKRGLFIPEIVINHSKKILLDN